MNPTTRRPKFALLLLSLSLALATLPLASTSAAPSHWPGHARFVHATDDTPAEPEEPAESSPEPEANQSDPPVATESDPLPPAEEPPAESAPVADVPAEIPAEVVPAESDVTTETSLAPETADPAPAIEPSESFAAASTDETEGASAAEESNQTEDSGDFTAAAVPVAVDDTATTHQPDDVVIDVLANDTDSDGNTLMINWAGDGVVTTAPSNGSTNNILNERVRYTPDPGFVGADSFTYQMTDGEFTDVATVTITVLPAQANLPPVAVDDAVTTTAGTPIDIDVLANDTDPDGDELDIPVVFPVSVPANGSAGVARTANGSLVVYTPDLGFVGADTFTYLVSDGEAIDTGTVTVTVLAAQENQPPVAVDDTATTTEGAPVTIDVLANDSDPDGDALTLDFVDAAANGAAVVLDPIAGALTYTPNPGFVGVDSFFYEIRDGDSSTSALVTVTVTATPDPEPPVETPKAPKNEQPAPKQPAAKPAPKPAAVVATTLPDTGAGPFAGRDEDHALLLGLLTILFAALLVLRRRLA